VFQRPLLMLDQPKRMGETVKLMPNAPIGTSPEITHIILRRV
jgi:hypothetical protein